MIPMLMVIQTRNHERPLRRLYIPLPIIYLILLPFILLFGPFAALLCVLRGINPFRIFVAMLRLLASIPGTRIEIQDGDSSFLVRVV